MTPPMTGCHMMLRMSVRYVATPLKTSSLSVYVDYLFVTLFSLQLLLLLYIITITILIFIKFLYRYIYIYICICAGCVKKVVPLAKLRYLG
jgi:hypothetical protein